VNTISSTKSLTCCILALATTAGASFSSQAANFLDPPGSYKYVYWYASGDNVPTTVKRPTYTTGTKDIKLGVDYIIGGKATKVVWAKNLNESDFGYIDGSDEAGIYVYNATTPIKGCTNSCTVTQGTSNQICQSMQLQWGIDAKASLPSVGDVTFKYFDVKQSSACLKETDKWSFKAGEYSSSTYIQAITGVEYRYARVLVQGTKIVFTSDIINANTDNSKLKAAHALCLSQGWESGSKQRTDIKYFKQTVDAGKDSCFVPNMTLKYYVYGPHPEDAVRAESYATDRVNPGNFVLPSTYKEEDI
jgi:hypothetical protein